MDRWLDGLINGWIDDKMNGSINTQMYVLMNRCKIDEWIDRWINVQKNGFVVRCSNGQID